jgi:hypothetical protein
MRIHLKACLLAVAALALSAPKNMRADPRPLHLADYDAELRLPNGRVDIHGMVRRLAELGVTHYYWLVWHAPTDWEDLKLFLPEAARAHIEAWVYLVPPTEGPRNGYPASEPFKLDYQRWAEEIAKLSLEQRNLTGWVIDDFYANHQFFTPTYVAQMQAKAKAINPRLKFLPLMYFPEITPQFVNDYHTVIDGVVVAYPPDRAEILHARAVLNGDTALMPGELSYPWNTPSHTGDFVSASIPARVTSPRRVHLRFVERDDFSGATAGYHFKQVTLDGAVVWEQDVAGGPPTGQSIDLDLTGRVAGKRDVTVGFRLVDKKGVGNFGVRWRVSDLHGDGLRLASDSVQARQWQVEKRGAFAASFGRLPAAKPRHLHIPFIVMTAADAGEFKQRHGEPASPERIAEWLRMSLQTWREGQCDGVVTYCLDKRPDSRTFPLAERLFREFRSGH